MQSKVNNICKSNKTYHKNSTKLVQGEMEVCYASCPMHKMVYYHLKIDCDDLYVYTLKPKETTIIIKQIVIAN